MAADYDAVHLTLMAYLTTPGIAIPLSANSGGHRARRVGSGRHILATKQQHHRRGRATKLTFSYTEFSRCARTTSHRAVSSIPCSKVNVGTHPSSRNARSFDA